MTLSNKKPGHIFIISGPSGVGKSTICSEVTKSLGNTYLSISATTRPRSDKEINGRNYWFIPREEFLQKIEQGRFLEYEEVFGNLYGTPRDKVDQALAAGKLVILEIDVHGAEKVKSIYPDAVSILIVPPDNEELAERIHARQRDDEETRIKRLQFAGTEITEGRKFCDHIITNNELNHAIQEIKEIINNKIGENND